jgi:hypothetical protein
MTDDIPDRLRTLAAEPVTPTVPSDEDRERLMAHLDRGLTPRPAMLRLPGDWCYEWWLAPMTKTWFVGDASARVGPDPVGAAQRCGCEVCRGTVSP